MIKSTKTFLTDYPIASRPQLTLKAFAEIKSIV